MKKVLSEVGTNELHKRKFVAIDAGPIPRARVVDQCAVDRLLMEGLITLAQHQAAELLMARAYKAGIYAKAPDPDKARGGLVDYTPTGIEGMADLLRIVTKRYGEFHGYLVEEVVCHDWDIRGNDYRLKCLREGLQIIGDRRMCGRGNPAARLKRR